MSARQLIVLGIAAIAAIGALFFIQSMNRPQSVASFIPQAQPSGAPRVLVAARPLRQGQAVTQSDLAWRAFPSDGVSANYYAEASASGAMEELVGSVARRNFVEGEPIIQGTLIQRGAQGILAAQLAPGFRAVAVSIKPSSASGGFIQPNDRVDVILTRTVQIGAGEGQSQEVRSSTVLENVRVLTVGQLAQTEEEDGPAKPIEGGVATLELSRDDAAALALAEELGEISLVLRGVEEEPPQLRAPSALIASAPALEQRVRNNTGADVRIHAFGAAGDVRQGGAQ